MRNAGPEMKQPVNPVAEHGLSLLVIDIRVAAKSCGVCFCQIYASGNFMTHARIEVLSSQSCRVPRLRRGLSRPALHNACGMKQIF
jgi:hypothetical protein